MYQECEPALIFKTYVGCMLLAALGACFWQLASVLLLWYHEIKIQTRNRRMFVTCMFSHIVFIGFSLWLPVCDMNTGSK
jgi:hypothetical protein